MGRLAPALAALALVLTAARARADYLVLDDGRRVDGKIVAESAKEVRIKTSVGELTFKRESIVELKHEKTRDEVYAERLAVCKTAEDRYQLGLWCEEQKLPKRAEENFGKAIELDPDHAGARAKLGFVRYADQWMTPAQRDQRMAEERADEMRAKGLVEHEGRWVTPEAKEKLAQGMMLVDGRWVTRDEALKLQGLAEYRGTPMPRAKALALTAADGFAALAPEAGQRYVGEAAVLIGTLPEDELKALDEALVRTRAWFDGAYGVEPGLKLFNGRLPEFYVFGFGQDAAYSSSADWVAGRSSFIPAGWAEAVKRILGFTWIDPIPISSARQGPRGPADLSGHCYHHMGHLMLESLGYDGRLLPPWYVEGVASLAELRTHDENKVFCRSSFSPPNPEGTRSGSEETRADFGEQMMRDGSWREELARLLKEGPARPFDRLAQLEFSQLQLVDIAQSMAIVEWLESRPGALPAFHKELRARAPAAPARVLTVSKQRQDAYNAAFKAAVGLDYRSADAEWKRWFLSR
jgi:hypothetical protein